jgi:hypothetical protein
MARIDESGPVVPNGPGQQPSNGGRMRRGGGLTVPVSSA